MAWIKIDRGLVGHKKIARLSARMKWSRFQSIGFMTAFWIWAAENCDDGQLGDIEDMEIAFAVNMEGQADGILEALMAAGFVDREPRRIHSWYKHQYEYLRSKYRREPSKLERICELYGCSTGAVPVQDEESTAPEKKREEEKREEKKKYSGEFDTFWKSYPRKVGKDKAWDAWRKKNPDLTTCINALEWQVKQDQWTKDGGQFIPHPSTWINQGRWADEKPAVMATSNIGKQAVHPLSQEVVSKKDYTDGAPANWFGKPETAGSSKGGISDEPPFNGGEK